MSPEVRQPTPGNYALPFEHSQHSSRKGSIEALPDNWGSRPMFGNQYEKKNTPFTSKPMYGNSQSYEFSNGRQHFSSNQSDVSSGRQLRARRQADNSQTRDFPPHVHPSRGSSNFDVSDRKQSGGVDSFPEQSDTRAEEKHSLHNSWCLFMLQDAERRSEESWRDSQVEVHEFATVEDFWCMVNHMHPPSHIGLSDYSLFKKGISPAWEDSALALGGRWVVKLPTKLRNIDELWLHLVMSMIGETLVTEPNDAVCGTVVSIRPRSLKLALWISVREPLAVSRIGMEFQDVVFAFLDAKDARNSEFSFQSFKDNIGYKLSDSGAFSLLAPAEATSEASSLSSFADVTLNDNLNFWDGANPATWMTKSKEPDCALPGFDAESPTIQAN